MVGKCYSSVICVHGILCLIIQKYQKEKMSLPGVVPVFHHMSQSNFLPYCSFILLHTLLCIYPLIYKPL